MNHPAAPRQALLRPGYEEALAERLDMNVTDLRALRLVLEEGRVTPGRIAEQSGLTTGAVTGVLDRLERAGYVGRVSDPTDRRRAFVQPTAAADDIRDLLSRLDQTMSDLLNAYPPDQQQAIRSFLDASATAVGRHTDELRASVRGGFVGQRYRAPLAGSARGRLLFASGAPRLSLNLSPLGPRAAARMIMETSASRLHFTGAAPSGDLVDADFVGPLPDVRTSGGTVGVRYKRSALRALSTRQAQLALSGEISWAIELDGGLTDLTGTLDGVRIERLEVSGGANHIDLALSRPVGTAIVRVAGVVSDARFTRPRGVPVALRVAGGISRLRLDGRRYEQVGRERRFATDDLGETSNRYEIEMLDGASSLHISTR